MSVNQKKKPIDRQIVALAREHKTQGTIFYNGNIVLHHPQPLPGCFPRGVTRRKLHRGMILGMIKNMKPILKRCPECWNDKTWNNAITRPIIKKKKIKIKTIPKKETIRLEEIDKLGLYAWMNGE